jgi:hypothetical protein
VTRLQTAQVLLVVFAVSLGTSSLADWLMTDMGFLDTADDRLWFASAMTAVSLGFCIGVARRERA